MRSPREDAHHTVTQSSGHTVGGIGRRGGLIQSELLLNHKSDLVLGRVTGSDDGLLYLPRCVFGNDKVVVRRSQKDNAASVAELEGTLCVLAMKNVLDGHCEGTVSLNERADRIIDFADANRKWLAWRRANDTAFDQTDRTTPATQYDAVSCRRRPGIDTENENLLADQPPLL